MDKIKKSSQPQEKREYDLQKIEWMLKSKKLGKEDYVPEYGDLSQLNKEGLILSLVDKEQLKDIASEYLDLLKTSAAVYERNGDYALGLFSSGWCRMMDAASRKLCRTSNNRKALKSGKWLCHESCWKDASLKSIKQGKPVDVPCSGGLHLYAVPVRARGEIIGSINVGYGDPPKDKDELEKLSQKYHIPVKELKKQAEKYQTRPPFIIDLAKRRLRKSAAYLGSLIEGKQKEKALQKKHDEMLALFNNIEDVIYVADMDTYEILFVNQFTKNAFGKELVGGLCYEEFQHFSQPCDFCTNKKIKELNGKPYHWEYHNPVTGHDYEIIDKVIQWPDGRKVRFELAHDITERKRAEEELASNYALLRIAGETTKFGGWSVDLRTNICTWSDTVADIHEMPRGYSPPVEDGINFYAPEWREKITRVFSDCAQKGIPYDEEMEIITKQGKRVWVRTAGRPLRDKDGKIVKVQGSFQDITERKKAEQKIKNLNSLLRSIRDVNQLIVQAKSLHELMRNSCKILHKTRHYLNIEIALFDDRTGKIRPFASSGIHGLREWGTTPDGQDRAPKCIKETVQTKKTLIVKDPKDYCGGCSYYKKDLKHQAIVVPMKQDGHLIGLLSVALDDTHGIFDWEIELLEEVADDLGFAREKYIAEAALKESERVYRALFEDSINPIFIVDKDGYYFEVNDAALKFMECSREEIIGKTVWHFVPQELLEKQKKEHSPFMEPRTLETEYLIKGKIKTLLLNVTPVEMKEEIMLFGVGQDITDRKAAKERIKQHLEEKNLLLRELYHRTKNNMQVIISMLNIAAHKAKSSTIKTVFKDIVDKIFSMSLVHQKLYEAKDLSRINLKEYIKDFSKYLLRSLTKKKNDISMNLDLQDVQVTIDTAIPLGLALTELISNSFKHAFPKGKKGQISIKLSQDKKKSITIEFSDDGVGIDPEVDLRKTPDMGLQNVFNIIEYQLGGKISYKVEDGLKWKIIIGADPNKKEFDVR